MKTTPTLLPLLLLVFSCAVAALLARFPIAGACVTPAGIYIQGWLSTTVKWLYWPAWVLLAAGGLALRRFAARRFAGSRLVALAPLAWLPALVMLPHGLTAIDRTLAGLVLPLGGAFLAAVCLERFLRSFLDAPSVLSAPTRRSACVQWLWFVVTAFLLLGFWLGVSRPRHFGGGDVKHYRILLTNLLERGDLDLTNRMDEMMDDFAVPEGGRAEFLRRSHMKVNEDGRIHSYHSFGFPLLAWPFHIVLGGKWGDGVLLALLGALALCGVRAACLAHGAPRAAADTVAVLTGLSYVWVFTAMSFLPEMLGFGLVAWAFWAVAAQERPERRWLATAVAAVTCAVLPLVHVRFTPSAGILAACFGIEGLFFVSGEPFWKRKIPRLAVFSLVCFGAWAALTLSHAAMYRGTAAYDYGNIAGRVPLVMWAMFTDRRGIVSVVPAVFVFLAATAVALFRREASARRAVMALAVVAATLWFCCCTPVALGGACLNGRYFYPVIPVLLPFFALALVRAARPGRLWMLFLALLPVLYLLFLTLFLDGSRLLRVPAPARGFMNLALLWEPFPSVFAKSGCPPRLILFGSLFSATMFGLSFLACTRRGPAVLRSGSAVALLLAAFVLGRIVDRAAPPMRLGPVDVLMDKHHFHDFRVLGDASDNYFSAFSAHEPELRSIYVLTDVQERPHEDTYRLQHVAELRVDDWRGRPLRWGKSRAGLMPLGEEAGFVAARATGRVVRGTARLALQVGGLSDAPDVTLSEGPFDVVFFIRVFQGNQGYNFRLALENDVGEAIIDTTDYVPCPPALLPLLGGFPPTSRVVEWDGRA